MKTITIDRAKWRCGGKENLHSAKGKGDTQLENEQGFCCCLGFATKQIAPMARTLCVGNPMRSVELSGVEIPYLTEQRYSLYKGYYIGGTDFTFDCMRINDDYRIAQEERERLLIAEFAKQGLELVFEGEFVK
jgi:hypothetical protein